MTSRLRRKTEISQPSQEASPRLSIVAAAAIVAIVLPASSGGAQTFRGIDGRTYGRSQVEAFLAFCSQQADARGLHVGHGYGGARYAFRRECMHKLGIDPQR